MPHNVFITYHHELDQSYKEELVQIGKDHDIFIDGSVHTGDISDELSDEEIRKTIRDEYLRESIVTIVLVGHQTRYRKHVDWEIHASMYDSMINKKSGILVINLPYIYSSHVSAPHGDVEKEKIHSDIRYWYDIEDRVGFKQAYPHMPDRILDNLVRPEAYISVVPWCRAIVPANLQALVEFAYDDRKKCAYDTSEPLRRRNGP